MSGDRLLPSPLPVRGVATSRECVIISGAFMALLGQIEVMKWRAGWEIGHSTDMVTYLLSLIFFIAVWGLPSGGMPARVLYCAGLLAWNAALDLSRLAYIYVVGVLLLPVKPEAVIQ